MGVRGTSVQCWTSESRRIHETWGLMSFQSVPSVVTVTKSPPIITEVTCVRRTPFQLYCMHHSKIQLRGAGGKRRTTTYSFDQEATVSERADGAEIGRPLLLFKRDSPAICNKSSSSEAETRARAHACTHERTNAHPRATMQSMHRTRHATHSTNESVSIKAEGRRRREGDALTCLREAACPE